MLDILRKVGAIGVGREETAHPVILLVQLQWHLLYAKYRAYERGPEWLGRF
jgi:hypothetical protein